MSAEEYAGHLIEQGISLEQQARTKTFDELFAPAQARFQESGMSEDDLGELVEVVRSRHRRRNSGRKP